MKTKKQHPVLISILVILVIFIVFKIVKVACNNSAQKLLDDICVSYPFSFAQEDYQTYVTTDFEYKSEYIIDGKEYEVSWDSGSELIKLGDDGVATVNRPEGTAKKVILTQTVKKGIGSASEPYELTLIPEQSEVVNYPISIDYVRDSSYWRKMELCEDKNGKVKYLHGDFDDTYVYSKEDAAQLANLYKDELSISKEIDFRPWKINTSSESNTYIVAAYYKDYRIENNFISISVDNKKYEVFDITNNVSAIIADISLETSDEDIEVLLADSLATVLGSTDDLLCDEESFIYENELSKVFYALHGDRIYSGIVSLKTGEILNINDTNSYFEPPTEWDYEVETGWAKDEKDNKLQYWLTYIKSDSSGVLKDDTYYVMDLQRGIIAYNDIDKAKKKGQYLNWSWKALRENRKNAASERVMKLASDYSTAYEVESPNHFKDKNFSDQNRKTDDEIFIAEEALASIRVAYDYYDKYLGKKSYDGKGTIIPIRVDMDSTHGAYWNVYKYMCICAPPKFRWEGIINPENEGEYIKENEYLGKQMDYTFATCVEALSHEYTHAVFGELCTGIPGREVDALNEAYADVLGCIISGKDYWVIGENYCGSENVKTLKRDLANFNDNPKGREQYVHEYEVCEQYVPKPEGYEQMSDEEKASTSYYKHWNSVIINEDSDTYSGLDEHSHSVVFSHVGYEMYSSGLFDGNTIAKIFIGSLQEGLSGDASMVDARISIMKAANEQNCSGEQLNFIAQAFDEVNIKDDNFVYYATIGDAVESDLLFDDVNEHGFVVAVSPSLFALGGTGFSIWEEGEPLSDADQDRIEQFLNGPNGLSDHLTRDGKYGQRHINYKRVSKYELKLIATFLPGKYKYQYITDTIDFKDFEQLKTYRKYFVLIWDSMDCTSYDFWDDLDPYLH